MAWFPERNDPDLERLADLVFGLRREVFRVEEYQHAPPGQWEDEVHERRRERSNQERLMKWDNDTLRMIRGLQVEEDEA